MFLFGGYKESFDSRKDFAFFEDCFEYFGKLQSWKMIHSETHPTPRAQPAVARWKNYLVLYGGYHGGAPHQYAIHNDLWMLDMNKFATHCGACRSELVKGTSAQDASGRHIVLSNVKSDTGNSIKVSAVIYKAELFTD